MPGFLLLDALVGITIVGFSAAVIFAMVDSQSRYLDESRLRLQYLSEASQIGLAVTETKSFRTENLPACLFVGSEAHDCTSTRIQSVVNRTINPNTRVYLYANLPSNGGTQ